MSPREKAQGREEKNAVKLRQSNGVSHTEMTPPPGRFVYREWQTCGMPEFQVPTLSTLVKRMTARKAESVHPLEAIPLIPYE